MTVSIKWSQTGERLTKMMVITSNDSKILIEIPMTEILEAMIRNGYKIERV